MRKIILGQALLKNGCIDSNITFIRLLSTLVHEGHHQHFPCLHCSVMQLGNFRLDVRAACPLPNLCFDGHVAFLQL